MTEEPKSITKSDLKALEILKDHREVIFRTISRTMGYQTWYKDFYKSDGYYDYNPEDRFQAADIFNRLNLMFEKLHRDTELFKGLE